MKVQFIAASSASINTVPIVDGQVIALVDQVGYYYDFNSVRYKVNGSGGTAVSFIQSLTSGTKVGEIIIDGQSTDVYAPTQPTSTSQLTNDTGFITGTVNNLVNYYLKSETYTQSEIKALVNAVSTVSFEIVDELPTTNIRTNVIYLVPKPDAHLQNIKDQYVNLTGTSAGWEQIGDTDIDLSGYVTVESLNSQLSEYVQRSELSTVLGSYATIASIPTKTSDLINDSSYVSDTSYVHTDNNYTTDDKLKLAGIAAGAEINVQADWAETDSTRDSFIQNKPTIPAKISDLQNDSDFASVIWNQIVTSGDQIAEITVNNVKTPVYAPNDKVNAILDGMVKGRLDAASPITDGLGHEIVSDLGVPIDAHVTILFNRE